jgi:putative DNA methylase
MKLAPTEVPFRYIEQGIEAKGHTPIYKMHKYFARRPHNVFRYLIESYTRPGNIILDCFSGGGVTLFEGLSIGRKVVTVDLNPLATFISDCQTTLVSPNEYRKIMREVLADIKSLTEQFYTTECRECGEKADVRWYELAYKVMCPACAKETLLSNENKFVSNDKIINGQYRCQHCASTFTAVNSERVGYDLLSVTYRCKQASERRTAQVTEQDIALMQVFEQRFDELVEQYGLWYPQDEIPANWDRQQEDCLHRKAIHRFADLFTKRGLFFNAYLLKCFQRYRGKVSADLYKMLIFTFSAIIRHTNNMTISTGNWMDGRPVSWAKHAYWIPNQFVEVNPLEYVEKRQQAIISGLKYQHEIIANVNRVKEFAHLEHGKGTHIIWTGSAAKLEAPDESVDAIVTDPPYGSNVQYGELSHYWLVWLRNELGLGETLFSLNDEILVNRKTQTPGHKDYDDYFRGLRDVFTEGFRVLKPGGVLVFTFNNKDMKAWYAVTRAAIEAGFYLDERGVIYQEPIENYRNTAHTRYAGSLHGDFIYTFRKQQDLPVEEMLSRISIRDSSGKVHVDIQKAIRETAEKYLCEKGSATTSELYVAAISTLIPIMVKTARTDEEFAQLSSLLELGDLDGFLIRYFIFNDRTKIWQLGIGVPAKEEA